MKDEQQHEHEWKKTEQLVIARNRKGLMSARDLLKQRKCKKCGKVSTYDLERTVIRRPGDE